MADSYCCPRSVAASRVNTCSIRKPDSCASWTNLLVLSSGPRDAPSHTTRAMSRNDRSWFLTPANFLAGGIDHPPFGRSLLGDCKLCLRFGHVSQAEQSFGERCTNPIFFFSPFILVFALNAVREQLRANSHDALADASGLDSVGDGVIAAEFGGPAIKEERKVDAVVVITLQIETLFVSKDRRCKAIKPILPRYIFRVVEALVNCAPQAQRFRIARPFGIKLPKDRFGFEQRRLVVGIFGFVGRPRELLNDVGIGLVALDSAHTAQYFTHGPKVFARPRILCRFHERCEGPFQCSLLIHGRGLSQGLAGAIFPRALSGRCDCRHCFDIQTARRGGQIAEESVYRAVNLSYLRNLPTGLGQLGLRPLDFLVIDPRTKMLVFSYHHVAHIEPHLKILFGDDNRGFRAEGVSHAKLEKRIDVGGREICDDQVRRQQALVHGHVDDPGMLDLVRAFARVSGHLGCRLDDVSISLIEIKILVLLEIGLLAVAHNHKATEHGVLPVWPRSWLKDFEVE